MRAEVEDAACCELSHAPWLGEREVNVADAARWSRHSHDTTLTYNQMEQLKQNQQCKKSKEVSVSAYAL